MGRFALLALVLAGCNGDKDVDTSTPVDDTDTDAPVDTDVEPQMVTDIYLQIDRSPVDLLVVVDNSRGMAEWQGLLADAYPSLVQPYLDQGIDFHVGVITTDVKDDMQAGNLRPLSDGSLFITRDTVDPEAAWREAVLVGEEGAAPAGIQAMLLATDPAKTSGNAGFLRPEARLELLVVSNHDDPTEDLEVQPTVEKFWALKAEAPRVRLSAVVHFPECDCKGDEVPGGKYALLQAALLGDLYDIASPTWTVDVASIPARNDARIFAFGLSGYPDPNTIAVEIQEADGDVVTPDPASWEYVTSTDPVVTAVVFAEGTAPDYGSTITVTWMPLQ